MDIKALFYMDYGVYQAPIVNTFIFETEETLAKSNTEHIDEDDDEYGWDD